MARACSTRRTHSSSRGAKKSVSFAWIDMQWSVAETGSGWLYYARRPGEPAGRDDVYLCVTDLADWKGVDASDPRWTYCDSLADAFPASTASPAPNGAADDNNADDNNNANDDNANDDR